MAAVNCLVSEDQFVCSICLNVFMDPVSTPCGHNFCKTCISSYWDKSNQCLCPLCKEDFNTRPQLKINRLLSEMASQLQKRPQEQTEICVSSEEKADTPEVSCDICSRTKLKAVKSCLVCLVSYCETHLDPHLTVSVLKRHQLIDPVRNLEDRMCTKHHKPLELFCKTDNMCVCMHCTYSEHKSHDAAPLHEECEERKAEVKQMVKERRRKIEEIHSSLDLSQKAADKETAEGLDVLTALGQSVQRNLDQLKEGIQEKLRKKEKQDKDLVRELQEEISQLEERSTEMEQTTYSQDQLHFLQRFTSLKSDSNMKNWTGISICQASFEGAVLRSLFELEKTFSEVLKKAYQADLKTKQKCAANLTFDPDTAHPNLVLTHGKKQGYYQAVKKNVPDNPERFFDSPCVLAQQSFSSGKFYFEVQIKGKTQWFLGVARESINRKGQIIASPQMGYWLIGLNKEGHVAFANPFVSLTLRSAPQKIGVFVHYEEGVVSFHDVDTAVPIYIFTDCCFREKLLPFFSPSSSDVGNSSPMIITHVKR